ncbi:MAG: hypothetical protein K9L77_01335, partial [Candidatus Omnitrophica bacterium]|nr:hypothetical protein [Candidatus Omnitrophota bacterium]
SGAVVKGFAFIFLQAPLTQEAYIRGMLPFTSPFRSSPFTPKLSNSTYFITHIEPNFKHF